MQDLRIALVGNAHIDMIYRWRLSETLDRVAPETFRGVLELMKEEPGLTYAQSQFALYERIEREHPQLFDRVMQAIGRGTWIVVGGKYVECDAMLPGGEALVRQFLVGQRYAREKLGVGTVEVAWVPDCFAGHCHTTPMIYSGCGVRYYVFNRGCPQDLRAFYWESPDGSRLFSYKIPKHYNLRIDETLPQAVSDWADIAGHREAMVLYGEGDHGGGPRHGDVEAIHELRSRDDWPELVYESPLPVLERAERSRSDGTPWPTYCGDLGVEQGTGTHRGALISQAVLKLWNRRLEHEMSVAESAATIGALCQRKNFYPRHDLQGMWKTLLLHQFHDTLPGTLVGDAVDDVRRDYENLHRETERLVRFGLEVLGSRIDTRGRGVPIVLYNPCAHDRTGIVRLEFETMEEPQELRIVDSRQRDAPFVLCRKREHAGLWHVAVEVLARRVPSLGYALYRVMRGAPASVSTDLRTDESARAVENDTYRVTWNDDGIASIVDKRSSTELLRDTANRLHLLEEEQSSSWHVRFSGSSRRTWPEKAPELVRNDKLEARVRWTDRSGDSRFIRELVLRAGSTRIEFDLTVQWFDRDALLKVLFPVAVEDGQTVYESPYGSIERPDDGSEWPCQNWLSHCNERLGVSLINSGTYSCSIHEGTIAMSVCRGARDMDPRMDEGTHTFSYAIVSHPGSWKGHGIPLHALELNRPLRALQERAHDGALPNWGERRNDHSLPSRMSFCTVRPSHVVVGALKVTEDDWMPAHLIVRLHETEGRPAEADVSLFMRPTRVLETNHIEDIVDSRPDVQLTEDGFRVRIDAHQLRTFRIELAAMARPYE